MAEKYGHIARMEEIMVRQEETVKKLEKLLGDMDAQQKDYEALFR